MRVLNLPAVALFVTLNSCTGIPDRDLNRGDYPRVEITEINQKDIPAGEKTVAILGATLVDGKGGDPLTGSCVIIKNGRIAAVGKVGEIKIPQGAELIEAKGLTLLPGLIDAHYHNEESLVLPELFLRNGVTSVRDPGEWIASYDSVRMQGKPMPRLFLTGPHINTYPPAYPNDAMIVQDNEEARLAVEKLAAQGATAIKVYFGMPVGMIREVCAAAHERGLPVTAHLEITNAMDAINAGIDGIEHITTFGNILIPPMEAEWYKLKVMADFNARRRGRYEMWNRIGLNNNRYVDSLVRFLKTKKTFVSPTLAAFEKRFDKGDSIEVNAFTQMLRFTGMLKKAGVPVVVGSHSYVAYAELGDAYFREMELLQEAGLAPMEIIVAATMENARFFRVEKKLGSIEEGKLADLVLIRGNPLQDIRQIRNIEKVMLNGKWVERN